jgi:DNA-binding CsgD family transcriptional regulator
MALDGDDPATAVAFAERLLRRTPPQRRLDRAPVLDILIRAHAATLNHPQGGLTPSRDVAQGGQTPLREVEGWVSELRELAALAGTAPLRAIADRAEGVLVGGERGRVLLEDAVDGFAGAPYEAAAARLELAAVLDSLGREEAAARERHAGSEALRRLGARDVPPPLPELTPREREVLALVAEGLTNRQLAERLVVSEHTVHRHLTNILRKLDLPSRAAAAALAVRSGL